MVNYTFTRLFLYDNWSSLLAVTHYHDWFCLYTWRIPFEIIDLFTKTPCTCSNVWNHRTLDIQINREREGEQIDQALVKSILAINAENGVGSLKEHKQNLEEAILKDTAAFYSRKASCWMQKKSYNEYMLAVLMLLPFLRRSIYLQY